MDMHCRQTPASELQNRVQALQRTLTSQDIDGAVIVQNSDLFYFAGTIQQAHLYIPATGEARLMVRKSLSRAKNESRLAHITGLGSLRELAAVIGAGQRRIGMELDVLPVNLYRKYQTLFGDVEIVDISPLVRMTRAIKSAWEIDRITEAAQLADQVCAHAAHLIREGITEVALAGQIEAEARRLGHQGVVRMRLWGSEMFYGHLMAGPAAAEPSFLASPTGGRALNPAVAQGPSMRPIGRGEPILLDYVFAANGYLADHTRIFCIGPPPEWASAAHQCMLDLQTQLKPQIRAGAVCSDIYDQAIDFVRASGYADHFMGFGPDRVRFIGHGIGIELDEFPFIAAKQSMVLEKNMVIALEPKLIFPGRGVVGIENSHVVTANGLKQLTEHP